MSKKALQDASIHQAQKNTHFLYMLELLERIKKFDHLKKDSVLRAQLEATTFHSRAFLEDEMKKDGGYVPYSQ